MNVLVAEDDPAVAGLLTQALSQDGHRVVVTEDGEAAWDEYRRSAPEVVIADWMMPRSDGLELCRRIRSHPANPYTYIVVVTGRGGSEHAVEVMHAGADDHLPKPFAIESLEARMVTASRLTALHRTLADEAEPFRSWPEDDGGERLRLAHDLATAADRSRRYGHSYSLAVAEVDHLTAYRNHDGDDAAAQLLREAEAYLRRHSRTGDAVYRYRADRLVLLLPEQTEAMVLRAAQRLRIGLEQMRIPQPFNPPKGVLTLSMGIARYQPGNHPGIVHTLVKAATLARRAGDTGGDIALMAR